MIGCGGLLQAVRGLCEQDCAIKIDLALKSVFGQQ
jgi:hypothetical protein